MDKEDLDTAAAYYAKITGRTESEFREQIAYPLELGASTVPFNRLVNGLTSLRRATWDIETLLREEGSANEGFRKAHLVALGLLFEVRVKLDYWVAEPAKALLAEQGKDSAPVLLAGVEARRLFEVHHAALKVVRDRVFHARPWAEDEVITALAQAMFRAEVPTALLAAFEQFGAETVRALCKERIGIPGIGCFGIICL